MDKESKSNITLRDILFVIFRQKYKILTTLSLILIPVVIRTITTPPRYEASARILVEQRTFTQNGFRLGQKEEINSAVELVRSWPVAEKMFQEWLAWQNRHRTEPQLSTADYEKAIADIQRQIKVEPVKGSNIIQIWHKGNHPEEVALLVNALANAYLDYHGKIHQSSQIDAFFVDRIRETESRLDSLEKTLNDFLKAEGLVAYDRQVLNKWDSYHTRLTEIHQNVIRHRARLSYWRELLVQEPERKILSREIEEYPLVKNLNEKILNLKLQRNALLEKYTSNDRQIKMISNEIEKAQDELSTQVHNMIQLEQASLEALLAEEKALNATVTYLHQEIKTLPEKERTIIRLNLAIDNTRNVYSMLVTKYEEAKIAEASDRGVSKVKLVSPATVPVKPCSPQKILNISLGFIFGMTAGLGIAFLADHLDHSFRSKLEVERYLGLPVLASFSEGRHNE